MPEFHPSGPYFEEVLHMPVRKNRHSTENLAAHIIRPQLFNNYVEMKPQILQVVGPPG